MPVPKRKIEEFVEEIEKAESSEELLKIANRIKTYFDIHGDTSVLPVLIELFIRLSKFEDAEFYTEALKEEDHGLAKLFKAKIEKFKENFIKAEQLFNEIINDETIQENIKINAFWEKVSLLGGMFRYKEILETFKQVGCSNLEEIKKFITDRAPEEYFDTLISIYYRLQNWKEADDYFSRPEKQNILKAIHDVISRYSQNYTLSYSLESDWEYPVETLYVTITFFHPVQREKIEELKRELIEKTFFEMGEDIVFRIGEDIKEYATIGS
jgi:tetratricopeptide (TPR) repeat protein